MGILNATPDSFFDQGRFFAPSLALQRGIQLYQEGADLIDIGGESTRPGAAAVSAEEETERVIPLIRMLKKEVPVPLSIDTMKFAVAKKALEAGASFINDVSGFRCIEMQKIAADARVPICVMHMHQTPATMQQNPQYPDGIIPFLIDWFKGRIDALIKAGVNEKQIILDPGIGFGKTVADNVEILQNLHIIKNLGFPLLIGLSRKSFLGKILNKNSPELLAATIAGNLAAVLEGTDYIRVHDVSAHADAMAIMRVLKGIK